MKTGAYVMIASLALGAGCVHASSSRAYCDAAMRSARYRAAFDLECSRDEIEVECIDMSPMALERGAMCFVAGARGCGRRASYRTVVVTDASWNRRLATWALEGVWSSAPRVRGGAIAPARLVRDPAAPTRGPRSAIPRCEVADCRAEHVP